MERHPAFSGPGFSVVELFGLPLLCGRREDVCDALFERSRQRPCCAAFVNAHCVNVSAANPRYREVLQSADVLLPDGSGISIAARLTGQRLLDNLNGTDLFPVLCRGAAKRGAKIFLLGGRPGVAESAARRLEQFVPGVRFAGVQHGYFSPEEEAAVIECINASGAELLLVGTGVPHQDIWLAEHRHELKPRLLLGVGGLFDYYSGRIPRAPASWRKLGIEWLWRLLQEPRRLARRYLIGNVTFLCRALVHAALPRPRAGARLG